MKKKFIVLLLAILLVVAFAACTSHSWSTSGMNTSANAQSWTFNARSVNGNASRNVELDEGEIAAISVLNSNDAGSVKITFSQEGNSHVLDVASEPTAIDLDLTEFGFTAGKVDIFIEFAQVEGLNLALSW